MMMCIIHKIETVRYNGSSTVHNKLQHISNLCLSFNSHLLTFPFLQIDLTATA